MKIDLETWEHLFNKRLLNDKGLVCYINKLKFKHQETLREERMRLLSENPPPQKKPTRASAIALRNKTYHPTPTITDTHFTKSTHTIPKAEEK